MKNNKGMIKRALAFLLCAVMLFGSAPLNGIAQLDFSRLGGFNIDFTPVKSFFGSLADIRLPGLFGTKAAADDTVAELECDFDEETGTLTISGTGRMPSFTSSSPTPWNDYKSSIKHLIVNEGITSISNSAFSSCNQIESIILPNSLTGIGSGAFNGCSNLTSATIPENVTAIGFYVFQGCSELETINFNAVNCSIILMNRHSGYWLDGCTSLTTVTFGSHVEKIPEYAFYGCVSLTSITISNCVTNIEKYAFYGCRRLTSITIPNCVTNIEEFAFAGCGSAYITIPDNVASVGESAFMSVFRVSYSENMTATGSPWGARSTNGYLDGLFVYDGESKNELFACSWLISGEIVIPDSVTNIGDYAFSGCSSLTSVIIPDSVTSIGDSAFSGCTNITTIDIPDSVTSIGNSAFSRCSGLTSVIIPDSITSIGDSAFSGCTNITTVDIPDSVTSIGNSAFSGCSGLTSVIIPDSVTSIGDHAFAQCTGISSLTIPGSVKTIEESAFFRCMGLSSLVIENGVERIGTSAFFFCKNLNKIVIPASVKFFGAVVFSSNTPGIKTAGPIGGGYDYEFGWTESFPNKAFSFNLSEINIPDSIINIPPNLFKGTAFYKDQSNWENGSLYCSNYLIEVNPDISEFHIKEGTIGVASCACGSGNTVVYIPDSVQNISGSAFYGVFNIRYSSQMTAAGTLWGARSANGFVDGIFAYNNESKTELISCMISASGDIDIPNTVTSISDRAFYNCTMITAVDIPGSVVSIGNSAFYGCSGLTSVIFPDSVTSIGNLAFHGCSNLVSVFIPDSVTSIDGNVFVNCTGLMNIIVSNDNPTYHSSGNCLIESESGLLVFGCNNSVIPDDGSVISIGSSAFLQCWGLTSVIIPDGVTSIGGHAFYGCTNITTVDIPNSVVTIGENAFYMVNNIRYSDNMTADGSPWGAKTVDAYIENGLYYFDESKVVLTGCDLSAADANGCVEVPDTVREVGDNCFAGANNVESIEFDSEEQIDFSTTSFADCKNLNEVSSPNTQDGITFMLDKPVGLLALTKSAQPANAKSASQDEDVDITDMNGILFCNRSKEGTYNVPDNIKYICENAFANCKDLTVNLDLCTLYSIGENAFLKCKNYSSWLEDDETDLFEIGNYVISAKSDLSSLKVAGSCKCIADGAFKDCQALVKVIFEGETFNGFVGKDAFKDTPYMTNTSAWTGDAFYAGHQLMEVRKTFSGVFTIPDGTTAIADGAFENCIGLTGVVVPASVRLIGSRAFENCANLTNVIFKSGSGLKKIGRYAFLNCLSLKNITIPAGVDDIGEFAFMNCDSLVAFVVNSGNRFYKASKGVLFRIGSKGNSLIQYPAGKAAVDTYTLDCARVESFAFRNCGNIYNINPASNNIILGYRNPLAKSSALYKYENYIVQDSRLVRWTAPQGEDNITLDMSGDENLRRIKEIGSNAFEGETKLINIVFNSSLQKINQNAFEGCTGITQVHFNKKLEKIEAHAFDGCVNLVNIEFEVVQDGDDMKSAMKHIGDFAFTDTQVPESTTDIIKAAGCDVDDYAFHQHNYETTGEVQVTCTSAGGEIKTCTDSYCGKTVIVSATPALGHIFKDYTDNGNGTKTAVCCRDGCNETCTIPVIEIKMLKDAAIKVKNSINAARGSKVIIKATAVNVPSDFYLVIYEGSVFRAKGNNKSVSFSVDDIENNRTFTVKIVDRNGNPVSAENTQEEIKINIRQNFIERLIEFLINLFRLLLLFKV